MTNIFLTELAFLKETPASFVETTLIVHPFVLNDFLDYNDFSGWLVEDILEEQFEDHFQLATFHPQYQFAQTTKGDPSNKTNQSPYPMLHILRSESVEKSHRKLWGHHWYSCKKHKN